MNTDTFRRQGSIVIIVCGLSGVVRIESGGIQPGIGVRIIFQGNAKITIAPFAITSAWLEFCQSLVISGTVLDRKLPVILHIFHAVFFIIRIINVSCLGRFGSGNAGEGLFANIFFVNLKTAIAIRIKDGIDAVIFCAELINIVSLATFEMVTAAFSRKTVMTIQAINAVITSATFQIYLVILLVITKIGAKDNTVIIDRDTLAINRKRQGTVKIAIIRVPAVIHIIPVALHQIINQIACQFETIFQITHLQQYHVRAVADIVFRHTIRIVGCPKIQCAVCIK